MWHFQQQKNTFMGINVWYIVFSLSLTHICNSQPPTPLSSRLRPGKKGLYSAPSSSCHHGIMIHTTTTTTLWMQLFFFSTAILLYFFKLSSITIILHCIACCITICIYYYQISTYYLFWVSQKNEMTKKEIHLMLYTKSLQDISHHS